MHVSIVIRSYMNPHSQKSLKGLLMGFFIYANLWKPTIMH